GGQGGQGAAEAVGSGRRHGTDPRRGARAPVARRRRMRVPSGTVRAVRQCTRPSCARSAVATLTYVYADSTAVLGPLSAVPEPHAYDLCDVHAGRLSVPRGWDVIRLSASFEAAPPSSDDIEALADAVRAAARRGPREHRP